MAEKTAAKAAAAEQAGNAEATGTEKKAKKASAQNEQIEANRNRDKRVWTIEACKKAARRFDSEVAWKEGAPSSYKAATSHGWVTQCLATQKTQKQNTSARRHVAA